MSKVNGQDVASKVAGNPEENKRYGILEATEVQGRGNDQL